MSIIQSFREMSLDALGKIVQGGLEDFAREVIQGSINDALENETEDFLEKASARSTGTVFRKLTNHVSKALNRNPAKMSSCLFTDFGVLRRRFCLVSSGKRILKKETSSLN